jgi:hypothetical protein
VGWNWAEKMLRKESVAWRMNRRYTLVTIGGCFEGDFVGQWLAPCARTKSGGRSEISLEIAFNVIFLSKLKKRKGYTLGCLPDIREIEPNNDVKKGNKGLVLTKLFLFLMIGVSSMAEKPINAELEQKIEALEKECFERKSIAQHLT